MTRSERIETIAALACQLDDERQEDLLAMLQHATAKSTVYAALPAEEKASLEKAIAQAERGDVVPADDVFARIDAKLAKFDP